MTPIFLVTLWPDFSYSWCLQASPSISQCDLCTLSVFQPVSRESQCVPACYLYSCTWCVLCFFPVLLSLGFCVCLCQLSVFKFLCGLQCIPVCYTFAAPLFPSVFLVCSLLGVPVHFYLLLVIPVCPLLHHYLLLVVSRVSVHLFSVCFLAHLTTLAVPYTVL